MKISSHLFVGLAGITIGGFFAILWLQQSLPSPTTSTPNLIIQPTPPPPPTPVAVDSAERTQAVLTSNALRTQLAETQAQLEAANSLLAETQTSLDELRRPMSVNMLSSTLSAQLKSGEAVVTGGYPLPDGKRLYVFITPVVQTELGTDHVHVQGRVLAVTDEAGTAAGLDVLATNALNTIQHGEVWVADEHAAVLETLGRAADTDSLIYPDITLQSGGYGIIEMDGFVLKLWPTVGADHESMDLMVRMEQLLAPADAAHRSPSDDTQASAPAAPPDSDSP